VCLLHAAHARGFHKHHAQGRPVKGDKSTTTRARKWVQRPLEVHVGAIQAGKQWKWRWHAPFLSTSTARLGWGGTADNDPVPIASNIKRPKTHARKGKGRGKGRRQVGEGRGWGSITKGYGKANRTEASQHAHIEPGVCISCDLATNNNNRVNQQETAHKRGPGTHQLPWTVAWQADPACDLSSSDHIASNCKVIEATLRQGNQLSVATTINAKLDLM
jgi:hypothetical protein